MSNEQTGRPVPEHVVRGGRCSQSKWRKNRLVDQSPSRACSVVGAVNKYVMFVPPAAPLLFEKKAYLRINARCDRTSWHIVRLLRKKVRLVTGQPLFARSKKRKPSIMQKSHHINCDNYEEPKRHGRRRIRPLPQNAGSGRGGAVVIKA